MAGLCNCNYNKVKLLYMLSKMDHFIDKHALKDAEDANHPLCGEALKELDLDIEKHLGKFKQAIEGLCKEGKYH